MEVLYPDSKDIASKGGSTKASMKDVYKEYIIELSSNMTCVIKAFKYQKKNGFTGGICTRTLN